MNAKRLPARELVPLVLIAAYLVVFLTVRLPSIEQVTGAVFRRVSLLQLLLLPEVLVDVWFGTPARVALIDRVPILLTAGAIVLAAVATGWLILRALRLTDSLTPLEQLFLASAAGLGTLSNYTAAVGMLGWLGYSVVFWGPGVVVVVAMTWVWGRDARGRAAGGRAVSGSTEKPISQDGARGLGNGSIKWLWLAAPPLLMLLLGGMLPSADFDVLEYHLQAPKEFFQQGAIGFVSHNVYANMPLGSEMFALLGMSLYGDWFVGGLIGKTVIALTAVVAAIGAYCTGNRLDSTFSGVVAAVLLLNTPSLVDVATAGLVESPLTMYVTAIVFAALCCAGHRPTVVPTTSCRLGGKGPTTSCRLGVLVGYLAGCAAACKYPAVVFVVVPMLGWVIARGGTRWRDRAIRAGLFSLAATLGGGIWYVKNWLFTGNPVYPLLNEWLGGASVGWTADADARWDAIHRPESFGITTLLGDVWGVTIGSEWLGPLLIPLAVLGVMRAFHKRRASPAAKCQSAVDDSHSRSRQAADVLLLAAYWLLWLTLWWLLTHRIDRFWLPAIGVLAVLGGCGARWSDGRFWRGGLLGLLVVASGWNWLASSCPVPGRYPRYFVSLQQARFDPRRVDPWTVYFHRHRPKGHLLLIGEAAVWDYDVPILYSTCFDNGRLAQLFADKSPEQVHAALIERGISDVLVDWGEIKRYRQTYGFPAWIDRRLFRRLVDADVLLPCPVPKEWPVSVYQVARPDEG